MKGWSIQSSFYKCYSATIWTKEQQSVRQRSVLYNKNAFEILDFFLHHDKKCTGIFLLSEALNNKSNTSFFFPYLFTFTCLYNTQFCKRFTSETTKGVTIPRQRHKDKKTFMWLQKSLERPPLHVQ